MIGVIAINGESAPASSCGEPQQPPDHDTALGLSDILRPKQGTVTPWAGARLLSSATNATTLGRFRTCRVIFVPPLTPKGAWLAAKTRRMHAARLSRLAG